MGRTYKTPIGEYPSVTTVLALRDKSGPLMGWACKMGAEAVNKYLDELNGEDIDRTKIINLIKGAFRQKQAGALDIGSKVHNAIEIFTKASTRDIGLYHVKGLPEYADIIKPFSAFLKWHDNVGFKLIYGEQEVWSDHHKFAGTLDAIAIVNGRKTLVDYKSSSAFRSDYVQQIAAYNVAFEELKTEEVNAWGCLRLDKETGLPEWKEIS